MNSKIIQMSQCICGSDPVIQKYARGRLLFIRCLRCNMYGDNALTTRGCASKWNRKIFKIINAVNCLKALG